MNDDPAKQAWRSSIEIGGALPLDEVRAGASKLYRRVWLRNAVEYAACAVVVAGFGWQVFALDDVVRRTGAALTVAGVLFVAWQLYRRASADHPDTAGTMPILQFARAQLVRQRDALAGVLWWYLLPLVPGMTIALLGRVLEQVPDRPGTAAGAVLAFAVMVFVFAGVWWLNQLGARKLQGHIDEIDALTGGKE